MSPYACPRHTLNNQDSVTVKSITLNFSKIQAPSLVGGVRATKTGKIFPFVQPNLGGLRRKIKIGETNPNYFIG